MASMFAQAGLFERLLAPLGRILASSWAPLCGRVREESDWLLVDYAQDTVRTPKPSSQTLIFKDFGTHSLPLLKIVSYFCVCCVSWCARSLSRLFDRLRACLFVLLLVLLVFCFFVCLLACLSVSLFMSSFLCVLFV